MQSGNQDRASFYRIWACNYCSSNGSRELCKQYDFSGTPLISSSQKQHHIANLWLTTRTSVQGSALEFLAQIMFSQPLLPLKEAKMVSKLFRRGHPWGQFQQQPILSGSRQIFHTASPSLLQSSLFCTTSSSVMEARLSALSRSCCKAWEQKLISSIN